MKVASRSIALFLTLVLSVTLVACSASQKASDDEESSSSSSSSVNGSGLTLEEKLTAAAEKVVECDGDSMTATEWASMIGSNALAMEKYLGKEIIAVSDFLSIQPDTFYYEDKGGENAVMMGESPKYTSPVGLMNLNGFCVEIPETDKVLISNLKPGDLVKVSGVISGYFSSETVLLLPSSGAEYAGNITIEVLGE